MSKNEWYGDASFKRLKGVLQIPNVNVCAFFCPIGCAITIKERSCWQRVDTIAIKRVQIRQNYTVSTQNLDIYCSTGNLATPPSAGNIYVVQGRTFVYGIR
jgi:hypothetical protein